MKTFRFVQTIVIACAFAICCSADASAQKNHNWREKIMCEKIAFLTTELDLSTKEAQEFWPVYNEYMKEIENAQKAIYVNYKALNEAIKEAKPEKEVAECLDKYLKAQEDKAELTTESVKKFRKVLSEEKVAKLYLAEEKFRRNQITRLHHNHGPQKK
jgi:2,3-bisphosphoglycerate-independent phosphoglycerate mutase